MPISHKDKLIFIHIPKTGGGSIEKTLKIYGTENNGDLKPNLNILYGISNNKVLQHLTLQEILEITKNKFNDYKIFTFVRNPYDRIVSEYLWRSQAYGLRKVEFKEFLNEDVITKKNNINKHLKNFYKDEKLIPFLDVHYIDQIDFLKIENKIKVDHIGKFENINNDFKKITTKKLYHKVHASKFDYFYYTYKKWIPYFITKNSYRRYYDNETYDLISKYYIEDINKFNYKF